MKITLLTIILIELLASCRNTQNILNNKTFIAETGKGCSKTLGGGCNETYFIMLHFTSENKVSVKGKNKMICYTNQVRKDTTITEELGVFDYEIKDDKLVFEGFNRFNGGFTINKLGGITAIDRVSEIDEKYYFKEKQ